MFDHSLERTVAQALAANPDVDDDEIAVECSESGHVVLRGHVSSPAGRAAAVRTARHAAGVTTVDDHLQPERPGAGARDDARTEAAVLNAMSADGVLPLDTIDVQAKGGTVTLRGIVDLPYQRDEAEQVAMEVDGVSEVHNHLEVWMAVSTDEVDERVTKAIGTDAVVGADRLTVTARDNVVTLSGTVRTAGDRDAALAAASDATAVVDVVDEIAVAS
jgi:osmotically-inducible protein OsmY